MATNSKQLNDWLVALSPLGNPVFLSYIICVHSKHNLTISISAQQQQPHLFPIPKNIRRMGTSFRSNDFWDGLGGQASLMIG